MTAGGGFEAGRPMLSWQGGSSLPWVVSVSPEDRKAALGTAAPSLPPMGHGHTSCRGTGAGQHNPRRTKTRGSSNAEAALVPESANIYRVVAHVCLHPRHAHIYMRSLATFIFSKS